MKTPSIFAILTILVSIATAGLGFVSVGKVKEVIKSRDNAEMQRDTALSEKQTALEELDEAKTEIEDKDRQLADRDLQLKSANNNFQQQLTRANSLERQLNEMTRSSRQYERELSLWEAVGLSIDDAKRLRDNLRAAEVKISVLEEEGEALSRRVTILDNKLKLYELDDYEVKLPNNIAAKVTAVDPKYHFVVINIGRNKDLLEQGKVSISRDGKLVAKARITKVDETTSIANPLAGWSIDNIQQGDRVLTAIESMQE